MRKIAVIIIGLFISFHTAYSQISINGPTCVTIGNAYTYTISGPWGSQNSMNWCITGGVFVSPSVPGSCRSGTPLPQVTVKWTSSTGSISLSTSIGNPFKSITGTSALSGGTISSNLTQTITTNIPATITCPVATGGYCTPSYTYQWQNSADNINWTNISGATGLNLSFTAAPGQTTYYRRSVTETNTSNLAYSNTATVFVSVPLPLSAGNITSSLQTVLFNVIPANIVATPASNGSCSGVYKYQWQFSYNGSSFADIDSAFGESLVFFETLDSNTFFRRRVACGTDTLYTAAQMITVIRDFDAGRITTTTQTIPINTIPGTISATTPTNGTCSGAYVYQWQQSTDGITFTSISGGTSQNLTPSSSLTANTYFRRKAVCNTSYGYTNTIAINVKQTVTAPPVVKNGIDSLLESAGVNIATLFNLSKDTIANNRNDVDTTLQKAYNLDAQAQQLNNIDLTSSSTLEQANIDSLLLAPLEDNIATRLATSSSGGSGVDSLPALAPFLDDNVIQLYRSTGNYAGLDSLAKLEPTVSREEAYAVLVDPASTSQASSRTIPTAPVTPFTWMQGVVINGPTLVTKNQTVSYTGTFYFPLGSPSDIRWVVTGGTIVSQNINPANGPININITWNSSFGNPFIGIFDMASGQFKTLVVKYNTAAYACRVYPAIQQLFYGQVPCVLNASTCYTGSASSITYQWQVLDVYSNTNWTDIAGATTATYQPPAATNAWLTYRRITKIYNASGTLVGTFASSAANVQLQWVNPGTIAVKGSNQIAYNTNPLTTQTPPFGGYNSPGTFFRYFWEYSTDGGTTWASMSASEMTNTYPPFPITANIKVRRSVQIAGAPTAVYSLPAAYWKSTSNEIDFTSVYQTADFENRNYIRENVVLTRGIQSFESADALAIDKKIQTTTYLDGLSRPIQIVGKGTHYDETTTQWYDMVQSITYEAGGRVDKSLLAYPSIENIGKFKNNVATDQPAYYSAKFGETNAFARVDYDGSPLNRVLKSYAPGLSWSGNNIGISGDAEPYDQSENVKWFTIGYNSTDLPVLQGTYPSLFLIKAFGKDEKLKKVITYTNRVGQVVLKKVQLADSAFGLTAQHQGWLCIYYVYNDLGQLRYTITPKGVKELEAASWVMTQDIADELCFWYDYDDLGRTVAKKTPGKGVEYIVYDKRNRPVFTQDANQRAKSPDEWITALYDDLNRPVLSGIYKSDNTRDQLQTIAATPNTLLTLSATNGGTINLWGSPLTATDINNSAVFTQLAFSYYDNYTYTGAKTYNSTHQQNLVYKNAVTTGDIEEPLLTTRTTGLKTGGKTLVLDGAATPKYLTASVFFDEEGRGIQGQSDNIKTGVDIAGTQYHFDGRVLSKSETHNGMGTAFTNFNILTKYKFDKIGRVVGIGKKINNTARSYIASANVSTAQEDDDAGYKITAAYKYDELGRMVKKTLSPTGGTGGTPLETIDYSYNMRGWLTGINKDYALAEYTGSQWDHFFGMYIGYDNRDGKFAAGQLNGQITGVQWKSQGDNTPRKFDFTYDNANRLLAANFTQRGNSGETWNAAKMDFSTKNLSYDENGNLLTMMQMGVLPGAAAPVTLDNLNYTYTTRSNKLTRVDDGGTAGVNNGKQTDFKDGENAAGTPDYSYDANGNLVLDNNKRITAVTYNYLDKPELITIAPPSGTTGGGTIKYVYSAGGSKIQKIVTENPAAANGNQTRVITTSYIGAFVYEKITVGATTTENLSMIAHEEGRIRVITPYINAGDPANYTGGGIVLPDTKQGVFDYFITDNLGNVRTTITEEINKASSVCTMEDANTAVKQYEEALFGNTTNNEVTGTRIGKPVAWNANTTSQVSKLQSPDGTATKAGPNVLLRVMAGDLINAKTDYYYLQNPGTNAASSTGLNAMLQSLVNAFAGGKAISLVKDQSAAINGNLTGTVPLQNLMNNQPGSGTTTAPRAYLNYLFFDEQFNFVSESSGFIRVSQAGDAAAPLIVTGAKAPKNGYVYVYLSNGSAEPVYFDNFTVSQERGRLIEENHYYAHGLKIAAISSKALSSSLNTKMVNYGYQGAFAEEVSEFELNYNEFTLRTYDPQTGRWTTPDPYDEFASPYLGMGNDPANNTDPSGGSIGSAIWSFFGGSAGGAGCAATKGMVGFGNVAAGTSSTLSTAIRLSVTYLALGGGLTAQGINGSISGSVNSMGSIGNTIGNGAEGVAGVTGGSGTNDGGKGPDIPTGINNSFSNALVIETDISQKPSGPNSNGYENNGSLREPVQSPTITIVTYFVFEVSTPQTFNHIRDATSSAGGKPLLLTYGGFSSAEKSKIRNDNTKSLEPKSDPWRDEYPFACTVEAKTLGSSVRYIPKWEQEIQRLELLYITRGLVAGDKIQVVLVPKGPPPLRAPVYNPKDVKGWKPNPSYQPVDLKPAIIATGAAVGLTYLIETYGWYLLLFAL
jgi:RHS repeat-associated protein